MCRHRVSLSKRAVHIRRCRILLEALSAVPQQCKEKGHIKREAEWGLLKLSDSLLLFFFFIFYSFGLSQQEVCGGCGSAIRRSVSGARVRANEAASIRLNLFCLFLVVCVIMDTSIGSTAGRTQQSHR